MVSNSNENAWTLNVTDLIFGNTTITKAIAIISSTSSHIELDQASFEKLKTTLQGQESTIICEGGVCKSQSDCDQLKTKLEDLKIQIDNYFQFTLPPEAWLAQQNDECHLLVVGTN